MALFLMVDQALDKADGDQWIEVIPTFSGGQVLVEYLAPTIPDTWDYLARCFKEVLIDGRWVADEYRRLCRIAPHS